MPTYVAGNREAQDLIAKVMKKHHSDLGQFDVSVGCVFALATRDKNGEPKDVPIKVAGYREAASVQINKLKERVLGLPDCTITIDGDQWGDWDLPQRTALIDHELTHVVLQRDRNNDVKYDDAERPKLELRLHDYHLGGFEAIAERYGEDSFEVQQVTSLTRFPVYRQLFLDFGGPS